MSAAAWPAPAKLNLFLHVTGRRLDGYHEIQTVFQLIDLADRLHFAPRADGEIRRIGGPAEVPTSEDLCLARGAPPRGWKAVRSLVPTSGSRAQSRPGGPGRQCSSDAATTLVALDEISGLAALSRIAGGNRPRAWGRIPLFIQGTSAWGEGIGERLTPLELPKRYFAIIFPGVGISSGRSFVSGT